MSFEEQVNSPEVMKSVGMQLLILLFYCPINVRDILLMSDISNLCPPPGFIFLVSLARGLSILLSFSKKHLLALLISGFSISLISALVFY